MLIEFQTTGKNFLYQIREQLKNSPFKVTDELTDPLGKAQIINRVLIGNDNQMRLDGSANFEIRVGPPSGIQLISASRMQIVQPVTIELVYLDDLIKWGDTQSPTTTIEIWVILDVSLAVESGEAWLAVTYNSVFPPNATLDANLRKNIGYRPSPVDLGGVQKIIAGLQVVNAGITCKPELAGVGSIAMRIELGDPDSGIAEWQRFLNGSYDDHLSTAPMRPDLVPTPAAERWAVFLESTLLETYAKTLLGDSFGPDKGVELRSDIDIHWSNPGGQARLDASFKAIAINVCDLGILGKYDVRIDVQIPILLSVPQDNTLRKYFKINFWKNDLDTAACIVAVSVFWPIIGWGKDLKPWEMALYELLILLVPLRFVAATILVNDASLPTPDLKDAKVTKLSDDEFQTDQDLSAPGKNQPLVLLDYRGLSNGLVLMGRQILSPDTCPPLIQSDHCGFEFKPPQIPCGSVAQATQDQLQQQFERQVYAAASAIIENVGDRKCPGMPQMVVLQPWDSRFLDDALARKLNIDKVEDDHVDVIAFGLRCPLPPDDYYLDPKPIQFLVKTNGGARVFTYPPFTKPSSDEIDKLSRLGAIRAVNECTQLVDPWWQHFHSFNPHWHVDPAVVQTPGDQQLWVMVFGGLGESDRMTARFGDRRVQSAIANSQGRAVVTVMRPEQSTEMLTLDYHLAGRERRLTGGRMFMSQVALTEMSRCRLRAPVLRLELKRTRDQRTLHAIHADGFSVIDLSIPAAPRIILERYGEQTLTTADGSYVIRERSIDVFDRTRCHRRTIPLAHRAAVATFAAGRLVIGGPDGLETVEMSHDHHVSEFFDIGGVTFLDAPELPGLSDVILAITRERTVLLQLLRTPVVVAEYDERPWFAGALQFDSYVATSSAQVVTLASIVGRVAPCHPHA
jgi:hypothetical protein